MKYGDFRRECEKTELGRRVFAEWWEQRWPLSWAIAVFEVLREKGLV